MIKIFVIEYTTLNRDWGRGDMSMKQCWVDDDRDPKTKNVEVDEFKSCSC